MSTPDQPFPDDERLIVQLEALVYSVRLAAKGGESTYLRIEDARPVVLLRMLRFAIVMICAMADKKKMGYPEIKLLFAEMRIAERKAK